MGIRLTCQLASSNPHAHTDYAHVCAAIKAFDSVGVSVAGFCLLKFGTVLRDDQRINGKFFCLMTQPSA